MIVIFLGVIGALLLVTVLILLFIWNVLAPGNRFFTFVKEGTAKIIVRGDKFEKIFIQWEGHVIDSQGNVIEGQDIKRPLGGCRFYGWWPILNVLIYDFKWSGVAEDGQIVHHSKETIDFVLLRDDTYWLKVEGAEDENLLPLSLEVLLTLRVVNPYKALFNVQNWLEIIINRMSPTVRDVITKKSFEKWIGEKENLGQDIFTAAQNLLTEFNDRYGVEVRKIQVKEINPPEEQRAATLKGYLAEQDKKAIEVNAQAEKYRLETVAAGEAARIKAVYKEIENFGDTGKLIRTLEAMEKSPLAASVTVQAVPGLPELLKGVFGKPPEDATVKDLKEIREMLEKLVK